MESLNYLKRELVDAQKELKEITVKKYTSAAWAPGIQDQYKSESYEVYTNPVKARYLKNKIADLENQIKTYTESERRERQREASFRESQKAKYEHTAAGEGLSTENPAIAARYNAQQRLFGMGKLRRTLVKAMGQEKKFKKLWKKAVTPNAEEQQQVADELNRMFR